MIWHSSDIESVSKELCVDINSGLPNGVAYQRLQEYGKNQITKTKQIGFLRHFLSQLNQKSVYALTFISLLYFVISLIYEQGFFYSSFLIIAIIVINAALTAYNQTICDRAIDYKRIAAIPTCTVIREGVEREISSSELVVGDIIVLNTGDYICADARLIETNGFRCSELALTGDLIPVEKDASAVIENLVPVAGRKNMVFSGCNVIHGWAKAIVVETGINTEIGKSTAIEDQSSGVISAVETKLTSLSKIINTSVIIICGIAFLIGMIIGLFKSEPFAAMTVKTLLDSLALGVCAIPESLPYITVVVTALGAGRLIKDGVIIKNTAAIETLAKTTVLCADKTGVFTQNHMSVKCVYNGETLESALSSDIEPKSAVVLKLANACSMLTDDATESAIEEACFKFNKMDKADVDNAYPRLASIPFDGERKIMTSINMIEGKPVAIIKGAPETVIQKCVGIDKASIAKICDELADKALRLICIAIKALDEIPASPDPSDIENNLKFAGIICIEDPPRVNVAESIKVCKNAGIKVVMITGDNLATASAVAKEIGIMTDDSEALSGSELEDMSDDELIEKIGSYTVFARISPAQKLRIVESLKASGEIVTVTGNGLDDADVLSVSDVGFAIGAEGNDVARGNADAIIKSKDFSSVVNVFKECYGLLSNIKKTVHYLLGCNISEMLIFIIGLLIFKLPVLTAVQLLWINLLTDALPVFSVTTQPYDKSEIIQSDKLVKGKIFDLMSLINIAVSAITFTVCALIAFSICNIGGISTAYTMAFSTIALSQIFHSLNFSTSRSIISIRYSHNKFMILSSLFATILTIILCITPAGVIFGLKALSFGQLLISLGLSLLIIPVNEVLKIIAAKKSEVKGA